MRHLAKRSAIAIANAIGFRQPAAKIVGDSQSYWEDAHGSSFRENSHWQGQDGLSRDVWLKLGEGHRALFDEFLPLTGLSGPIERIVEWGSGGGANAIHFAKDTRQYIGVDVSQASLDECGRVVRESGADNFVPVLIPVAEPEVALDQIPGPCDLFLCIYVFELIPTPEYGRRIMEIAHRLLRPGGVAMIQIKYATTDSRTRPRRWGYRFNVASMTTYPIDQFWELAETVGFRPKAVVLEPKQPLVNEQRYAYYFLERP